MKLYDLIFENNEMEFDEASATRTFRILRGMVPRVRTLAFITAENPHGQETAKDINRMENQKLETILNNGHWGYQKIKGHYGQSENSFLVRNMSKDDLIKYGQKFNQHSVIFGELFDENDRRGMKFQMISTEPESLGDVMGERNIYIGREGAQDFYSEIKGRKFQIPFYPVTDIIKKDKEEREVTRDYEKARWGRGDSGKILGSKKISDKLVKPEISKDDIDKIENLQEQALKTIGFTSYSYRGRIHNILKEYY